MGDVPNGNDLYWATGEVPYKIKKDFESFKKKFVQDKPYWDRQRSRCINGYVVPDAVDFSVKGDMFVDGETMVVLPDGGRYIPHLDITIPPSGDVWISGRMYFYLNFWKMPVEERESHFKTFDHPWFTDLTWENWMLRERARREFIDLVWLKVRQRGMSAEEACDSAWIWFFMEKVDVAVGAGIAVYNTQTFNMIKEGVKALANTAFFRIIEYDNKELFSAKNTGINIYSRTANGNAEIFNGLNRLYKCHIEEVGIMEQGLAKEMIKNIRPSISTAGGRRTGFIVMTGTSGKKDDKGTSTTNNLADLEEFMYNPEKNKLLARENIFDKAVDGEEKKKIACFIPAWKFRIMDKDGNALKEESVENWGQELKLLNKKEQAAFKQIEPMQTTDMFNIIPGGFFGDYISDKCNRARSVIITHRYKQEIERGFLDFIDPRNPLAGVEWRPDQEEGDIFIIAGEHPRMREVPLPGGGKRKEAVENLYLQGTDSIDVTEAKTSSSKLCSLIFKQVDKTKSINSPEMGIMNNLVAGYIGRPTESQGGVDSAFANSAKLSLYYHVRNMIEYTKILIIKWYEDNGLEGFLAPLPELVIAANIDRSQVSNRYGMPSSLIGHMLTKLRDLLLQEGFIEGIPFEFVLKAFSEFRRDKHYNCDITMAMVCVVAQIEQYMFENQINEAEEKQGEQQRFKGFKMVDGQLQENYS